MSNDNLKLADRFRLHGRMKVRYPEVGEKAHEWTILGVWVNPQGRPRGYRCQCSCGTVTEFVTAHNVAHGHSKSCGFCRPKKV